jgi:hypothetical protein
MNSSMRLGQPPGVARTQLRLRLGVVDTHLDRVEIPQYVLRHNTLGKVDQTAERRVALNGHDAGDDGLRDACRQLL